jgi:catechol 2,3-dioxygenase-like lactoylglutathione lyase family enzyme
MRPATSRSALSSRPKGSAVSIADLAKAGISIFISCLFEFRHSFLCFFGEIYIPLPKIKFERERSMLLRHVALTCSSEKKSDRFYKNLLGLKKSEPKILPVTLSKAIFDVEAELTMVNYRGEKVHFEIFISGGLITDARQIEHVCLEVDDLQNFLKKCRDLNVEISQIPKGGRTLTFIRDYDGNLFEIK